MTSAFGRRLRAEWDLLNALAALNPHRLSGVQADDTTLRGILHQPADVVPRYKIPLPYFQAHAFFVHFPVHFPAVPMEMFLDRPVRHPNIHPESGFVCLWDRHRVSNTVELAVHKLAAMLSGTLYNADAVHVMQPNALPEFVAGGGNRVAAPLLGITHDAYALPSTPIPRRRLQ